MMTFRDHRLRDHAMPMSTAWLLNDIGEAQGKQEFCTNTDAPSELRRTHFRLAGIKPLLSSGIFSTINFL
ncbi:MAG TPA: hypothetical protein VNT99_08050 [Methylomirabilota bacterium]|nr:hypothetical protein [Methylomirabilota bacterium]